MFERALWSSRLLALGATEEAALMGTAEEPALADALGDALADALADALGDADVCCARATDENSIAPSTESPINNNTFLTVPPPVACPGAGWGATTSLRPTKASPAPPLPRFAPCGGTLADPRPAGHPPHGLSLVLLGSC